MQKRLERVGVGVAVAAGLLAMAFALPQETFVHGLAVVGCVVAGGFAYANFGALIVLRRARNPRRLATAVGRDCSKGLPADEPVEDAFRTHLLGRSWPATPVVRECLPRTTSAAIGFDVAFLRPLDRKGFTELVLGRTGKQLVVCKADFPRMTLIATFPFHRIRQLERGSMRLLRATRGLLGISFDDGSSMALMYNIQLDDVVSRFLAPIIEGMQP